MNVYDEHMLPQLKKLQTLLKGHNGSDLKDRSSNHLFQGKAKLAEFLASTRSALTILDTRIDKTTFECIEGVNKPIRMLVGRSEKDIIDDIGSYLEKFRARGHEVEIRRHLKLHDRFIIFNGRCWMVSSSLANADQMTISIIECVDTKPAVIKVIGRKWREGKVFLK